MSGDLDRVHRLSPLPIAAGRGRLVVPAAVVSATSRALRASIGADGPHEGLVLWTGWQAGGDSIIGSAVVPEADHGWGHVRMAEPALLAATRAARRYGAGILAQVHSHPGSDTRHSDGDDELVLMPFEGMWSIVVARYGAGPIAPVAGCGLHQHQDGRWVAVEDIAQALAVLPAAVVP